MINEKDILKQTIQLKKSQFADSRFIDGVAAVETLIDMAPKVDEWVPCSERLPENIKTVLVTLKEMEQPTIGWYGNIDGWRLSEKEFCCIEHEVIAWMPLPEPYQG